MKRTIGILVAMLFCIGIASATTSVDVNWNGFGKFDTTFNSGDDAVAQMWTTGNTAGNFQATDSDDNPYNYGVDSTSALIRGDINGGGSLEFNYLRTDRQGSADAGEFSNSFVGSSGTGSMDFRTSSNYHDLVSSNYGFQSSGQFQAIGDLFTITHTLQSANVNNLGNLVVSGDGSAVVDYMTDGYTAGNGFRFGSGDGCFTNANILTTGNGVAQVYGQADNYLSAYDGSWTMPVGGSHTESWIYNDGLSVTNYAFNGN